MQDQTYITHLWQVDVPPIQGKPTFFWLWITDALLCSLALEARESSPLFKEVLKGSIQILE